MVTTQKSPPAEPSLADVDGVILTLPSDWAMTDDAFAELLSLNEEWRFEVDEAGRLIITDSGPWVSSTRAVKIGTQFQIWADQGGGGVVSGEGGYIKVSELGRRAPDVAWASAERAAQMSPTRRGPGEVVPDLIVEIRSPSDSLTQLQRKLDLWITRGARLAWLIDPDHTTAHIYRPGQPPEVLSKPQSLSGEDIAPGLTVDLTRIWPPA